MVGLPQNMKFFEYTAPHWLAFRIRSLLNVYQTADFAVYYKSTYEVFSM